jgi:hypothetical protein
MPRIRWANLPESIRKHLLLRLKERQITEEDLLLLKLWRESELPLTFLLRGQAAKGRKL